jgi:hypothetical protein
MAAPPGPDAGPFVCPSVSLNNPNGMWVLGQHGAYYVNVPKRGSTGDKVYVKDGKNMEAQTAARYGLYKDYPGYPLFSSQPGEMIGLLAEGLAWLPGAPVNWMEGDVLSVMDNMDGTYTVMNMGSMMDMPMVPKGMLVIDEPIPVYSALFW